MASCDVSSAMMEAPSGQILTTESIEEAISFRQVVSRMHNEMLSKEDWFFTCWQPPTVQVGAATVPFHEVDPVLLKTEPNCWVLHPNAIWHGFGDIEEGYCMLDPIKVSVLSPGMGDDGNLLDSGIPACVLTAYLGRQGIVVEKTTDFTILFLFSIGITKGKWVPCSMPCSTSNATMTTTSNWNCACRICWPPTRLVTPAWASRTWPTKSSRP
jgi:arginine/lysine/ornithine decarboxylase